MNTFTRQALAALVLAGVAAAPAAASVQRDVQQAITGGNVNVTVSATGVATLSGYTDGVSRLKAERVVQKDPQVTSVINLVDKS